MQRPPHHLHRVALRRPRGQGIQTDATPGALHVFPHPLACVAAVVVCREVQLFVAAVSPPQMVEQLDEKLAVLAPPHTQWKRPVLMLSAPLIHALQLVPGVRRGLCLPLRIQQKPTLGLVSSLVSSWKNDPASSVICKTSSSLACFSMICSSEPFSGGTGRGLLQRKPKRCSARRSVSRLTSAAARSLRSWRARISQLQRERSQPCSVGESSSSSFSRRSLAFSSSNGLGPRLPRGRRRRRGPPGGSGRQRRRRWCASRRGCERSRWARARRRRAARCAS